MRKSESVFYGTRRGTYEEQKVRDRHYSANFFEDTRRWAESGHGVQVIPANAKIAVVDIDLKNMPDADPDLYQMVLEWLAQQGVLVAKTAGGYHIYLSNPSGKDWRGKLPYLLPFGLAVSEVKAGYQGVNIPVSQGRHLIVYPDGATSPEYLDPTRPEDLERVYRHFSVLFSGEYPFVLHYHDYLSDTERYDPLACVASWSNGKDAEDGRVVSYIPEGMRNTTLNKIAQRIPADFPYWDLCRDVVYDMCNPRYDDASDPYRPMGYPVQNYTIATQARASSNDTTGAAGEGILPNGEVMSLTDENGKVVVRRVCRFVAEWLYHKGVAIPECVYDGGQGSVRKLVVDGIVRGSKSSLMEYSAVNVILNEIKEAEHIRPLKQSEKELITNELALLSDVRGKRRIILSSLTGRMDDGSLYLIVKDDESDDLYMVIRTITGERRLERLTESRYVLEIPETREDDTYKSILGRLPKLSMIERYTKNLDEAVKLLVQAAEMCIPQDYNQRAIFAMLLPIAAGFSRAGVYLVGLGGTGKSTIMKQVGKLFGGEAFNINRSVEEINKALVQTQSPFLLIDEIDKLTPDMQAQMMQALYNLMTPAGHKVSVRLPYDIRITRRDVRAGMLIAGNNLIEAPNMDSFLERFVRIALNIKDPRLPLYYDYFDSWAEKYRSYVLAAAMAVLMVSPIEKTDENYLRDPDYIRFALTYGEAFGVKDAVAELFRESKTIRHSDEDAELIAQAIDEITTTTDRFTMADVAKVYAENKYPSGADDYDSEKPSPRSIVVFVSKYLSPKSKKGSGGIEKVNNILRSEYGKELRLRGVELEVVGVNANTKQKIYGIRRLNKPTPPTDDTPTPTPPPTDDTPTPTPSPTATPDKPYTPDGDDIPVRWQGTEHLSDEDFRKLVADVDKRAGVDERGYPAVFDEVSVSGGKGGIRVEDAPHLPHTKSPSPTSHVNRRTARRSGGNPLPKDALTILDIPDTPYQMYAATGKCVDEALEAMVQSVLTGKPMEQFLRTTPIKTDLL